jgi:imidazolonepropionase-like amidohydrolase
VSSKKGRWRILLLVDCDPLQNINLIVDPANNFIIIMKNGKIIKNTRAR